MTEVTNIRGVFTVDLAGQERGLKANFDAIERLEGSVFKGPIITKLQEAVQGRASFKDVAGLIHTGLVCNKDTRLSREEVGAAVFEGGLVNFLPVYIDFLTYCITGGQEGKNNEQGE